MNEENFEIVPISTVMQNANLSGQDNPFLELMSQLEERIQVGMEIIELKWKYKGKIIYSIGIASNEQGGMIYDHIGHFLITNTVNESDNVEKEFESVKVHQDKEVIKELNFSKSDSF